MTSPLPKYRLGYSKLGKVRFLGHRDVARMWERTLRRAGVPVAMSTGFTPRARISFGLALPTGAESLIELLDILVDPAGSDRGDGVPDCDVWAREVSRALPAGFELTHLAPSIDTISLQESVTASSWILLVDHPEAAEAVERVKSSSSVCVERERKGETHVDDIRSGILSIDSAGEDQIRAIADLWPGNPLQSETVTAVSAMLTTSGRGIRPTELVKALHPDVEPWDVLVRVLRTNQWIDDNGRRVDVLSNAMARASVCA